MSSDFGGIVEGTMTLEAHHEVSSHSIQPGSINGRKKTSETVGNLATKKKVIAEEIVIVDTMKAKIDLRYAFGCSGTSHDSVLTFAAASNGDKDSCDRLVYRVGKYVCVLDPENGNQQFFTGRSGSVSNVIHFSISPNQKCICMCESTRGDDFMMGATSNASNPATAQLSVYSLVTFCKLKTLSYPCQSEFVTASFCGDPKYITAMTGDLDKQIIVWHWEKDKIHKTINLNTTLNSNTNICTQQQQQQHNTNTNNNTPCNSILITRLRSAPCGTLMLTTSGPGHLKSWFLGPDGYFRPSILLQNTKENENFTDHCWLNSVPGGLPYKMIALTDPDSAGMILYVTDLCHSLFIILSYIRCIIMLCSVYLIQILAINRLFPIEIYGLIVLLRVISDTADMLLSICCI